MRKTAAKHASSAVRDTVSGDGEFLASRQADEQPVAAMTEKRRPATRPEPSRRIKGDRTRPIKLEDLMPEADVRGGSGKAVVFGQTESTDQRKE